MNNSIFLLLLAFLCQAHKLSGQSSGLPVYSSVMTDVFTATAYPAAAPMLKKPVAGISGHQLYGLKSLAAFSLQGCFPAGPGAFTTLIETSAFSTLHEHELSAGYGQQFGNVLSGGLRFRYTRIGLTGYGASGIVSADIGMLCKLSSGLLFSSAVQRAGSNRYGKEKTERLPVSWEMGIGYMASPVFYTGIRFIKKEEEVPAVSVNMLYKPVSTVLFFAGWISFPVQFTAGAGYRLPMFRTDFCFSFHPQLGITPGMRILFGLKNESR